MSDQAAWCKLWTSALDDSDLENLSIHEWFCWARFIPYMRKHGREGKIRLRAPGTALINLFRVPSFDAVIEMIRMFPNYAIGDAEPAVSGETVLKQTYSVECKNWSRFQGDFSTHRVREFRAKKQQNETPKKRSRSRREVEEKNKTPLPPASGAPEFDFDLVWKTYPKPIGKKAAYRHFVKTVRTPADFADIQDAIRNYRKYIIGKDLQYVKHGGTWFNEWRDWVGTKPELSDYEQAVMRANNASNGNSAGISLPNANANAAGRSGNGGKLTTADAVLSSIGYRKSPGTPGSA